MPAEPTVQVNFHVPVECRDKLLAARHKYKLTSREIFEEAFDLWLSEKEEERPNG